MKIYQNVHTAENSFEYGKTKYFFFFAYVTHDSAYDIPSKQQKHGRLQSHQKPTFTADSIDKHFFNTSAVE